MNFCRLEDLARLRVNPSLKRHSRVDSGASDTCALFTGNTRSVVSTDVGTRQVPYAWLENVVALRAGDVVIANHLVSGAYPVYQVDVEDTPVFLAPHQTKVVPVSPRTNLSFLHWTITRSLFQSLQGVSEPPSELQLRTIRELDLYWPDSSTQAAIIDEHQRLSHQLRAAHEALISQREFFVL